ncbi:MAG: helix-turn-helix domain-containing protein [Firmicutes bacterium]|nr:helix-turn-helix domain-containing protein [Bacillota bacterium]
MKTRIVSAYDDEYLFAKNLKLLRQIQKPYLSQTRLAKILGVCRTTYRNYENGVRQAPAFFVDSAASYFGITTDRMLREKIWKE